MNFRVNVIKYQAFERKLRGFTETELCFQAIMGRFSIFQAQSVLERLVDG